MISRKVVFVVLLCTPVALFACSSRKAATPNQGGPKAPVKLTLSQVRVKKFGTDLCFDCDAVIDNRSGAVLRVQSPYKSAFDGLAIVIMDANGRKLTQQPYTYHQSIASLDPMSSFPLAEGTNCEQLSFPVSGLEYGWKRYRVLLVGTLPGSAYRGTLRSNLVTAEVK
jgi:hypothetical protein